MIIDFDKLKNNGIYLDLEQFCEEFVKEWDKAARTLTKYEARQEYNEELYQVYLKSDIDKFIREVTKWRLEEKIYYDLSKAKGIKFTRLRPVKFPLTEYMKFEYYCYLFNSKMGEEIFYIDTTNGKPQDLEGFTDFMIFDGSVIFIHNYNENGVLEGAWVVRGNPEIEKILDCYNQLLKDAKPYNDMYKLDEETLKKVEEKLKF